MPPHKPTEGCEACKNYKAHTNKGSREFSYHCGCECHFTTPTTTNHDTVGWEHGSLTFDELKNIMEVCYVNNVETKHDFLHISFAPNDVTGEAWKELREKMRPTTET